MKRGTCSGAEAQISMDCNDARGIAQMMRVGIYRPVMKMLRSQKLRMLLNDRKLLQSKAIAIDTVLYATSVLRSE